MTGNRRRSTRALFFVASLCLSRPSAATERIRLTGDDPGLVNRLAEELRASGYAVTILEQARIQTEGEDDTATVVVTTTSGHVRILARVRGHIDQHTIALETESSGMDALAQSSLHAAEAVRSMVETGDPEVAEDPLPPLLDAEQQMPPSLLLLPAPAYLPDLLPEGTTSPKARLAVTAGVVYSRPLWTLTQSFATRGQVLPRLSVGGALGLAMAADTEPIAGHLVETLGGTGQLFFEWEPLGTMRTWTPALGAGLRGEYTYYVHELSNVPTASAEEGQLFGIAPLLRIGASFLQPVRFRIDGTIGFRALSVDVAGTHANTIAPRLAPTLGLMAGLAFDVGTVRDEPAVAGLPRRQF